MSLNGMTNMKTFCAILMSSVIFLQCPCFALVQMSGSEAAMSGLTDILTHALKTTGTNYLHKLDELPSREYLNEQWVKVFGAKISELLFEVPKDSVEALPWRNGNIVFVLRNSYDDPRFPGDYQRHVILWNGTDRFLSRMISEKELNALFDKAGLALPQDRVVKETMVLPEWVKPNTPRPHVDADIEAAERVEPKSRIAARVGELDRAATNEADMADASIQSAATPEMQATAASGRRAWLAAVILAAALGSLAGWMFIRRRRP